MASTLRKRKNLIVTQIKMSPVKRILFQVVSVVFAVMTKLDNRIHKREMGWWVL